jgi:hypothetical protein
MPELGTPGSARGAGRKTRPYRDYYSPTNMPDTAEYEGQNPGHAGWYQPLGRL